MSHQKIDARWFMLVLHILVISHAKFKPLSILWKSSFNFFTRAAVSRFSTSDPGLHRVWLNNLTASV